MHWEPFVLVLGDPMVAFAPFSRRVHVHDDRSEVRQMVKESVAHVFGDGVGLDEGPLHRPESAVRRCDGGIDQAVDVLVCVGARAPGAPC